MSDAPTSAIPKLPTIQELLLNTPLYREVEVDIVRDQSWLETLRYGELQYDAYCPGCRSASIFVAVRSDGEVPSVVKQDVHSPWRRSDVIKKRVAALVMQGSLFAVHTACQRHGHLQSFVFNLHTTGGYADKPLREFLAKVGQLPSFEDVAAADLDNYKKLLGPYFIEMKKAGGLFSHGISIGAFVYLRRVFEKVIEDHHIAFEAANGPIEGYQDMRMSERITALSSRLPQVLVKNAVVYGILSKGVHELSEDECGKFFPVVRAALIAILEQDYERAQKQKAAEDLERELALISVELSRT